MISMHPRSILPTIGRIMVTVLAIFLAWGILSALAVFHIFINSATNSGDPVPSKTATPAASVPSAPRPLLWPQFPVHAEISTHELVLNGVPVTMQEWESSAPSKTILAYYQDQMVARGWRDNMKEIRSLAEEAYLQLQNTRGSTASQIVAQTRSNLDSCLELQRPGWCMSIAVEPTGESIRQSRVVIMAAPVASLRELSTSLAFAGNSGPFQNQSKPLEIERESGGMRYHMATVVKREDPAQAFTKSLAELRSKNWRLSLSPFRQGRSNYFAWVVKDKQYGTLSVKALSQERSSSVTFTEVTQE